MQIERFSSEGLLCDKTLEGSATVVLTSFDGSRQSGEGHVVGAARHPFTCLAFSPCGRYIATGE
ncbi:hypothetical protein OESDEN_16505, partial [Oesophagostomum dentatum]